MPANKNSNKGKISTANALGFVFVKKSDSRQLLFTKF